MFWKNQIVSLLRNKSIETCLAREFSRHSPARDTSILIDAFKNYFSTNNPGFEHNWFTFDNGCTVTISREGIYFTCADTSPQDTKENVEYSQWIICEKITKQIWLRTFIGKYPDISDSDDEVEDLEGD